MSACLEGCVLRNQHRPPSRDVEHTDDCKGCLEREAEFGQLCPWSWQRLNTDVIDAPGLVLHLRVIAHPGAGLTPLTDEIKAQREPALGSILSQAIDAADEIHAMLASYAHLILEEHPAGASMEGPDPRGSWHTTAGNVAGIRHAKATERLVRWLLPLLPWCSEQDWAGEMRRELHEIIATSKARWPMEDVRTRKIPDVPCSGCKRLSLKYTPPSEVKHPAFVACSNPDCGRIFSEDEWDRMSEKAA